MKILRTYELWFFSLHGSGSRPVACFSMTKFVRCAGLCCVSSFVRCAGLRCTGLSSFVRSITDYIVVYVV